MKLITIGVLTILQIIGISEAIAEGFEYIEKYKSEAKGLIRETGKSNLETIISTAPGFTDSPKEKDLAASELRTKADDKIKGLSSDNTDQEKQEREVVNAVRDSYTLNPHRLDHTVAKLQNKDFIKKSDAITSNPLSGLNTVGKTDCKVADSKAGGENVKFEEYFVDIEDSRIKEEKRECEEDVDQLFYCIRTLASVDCVSKVPCAFNRDEGGLYTGESNNEFMSASGGMSWRYNGDILSFGEDHAYLYGSLADESGNCHSRHFEAKFYIKNKANVSEFSIIKIHENNLLNISINGQLIRNGHAMGGGDCWHNAGKTSWDNWGYDIRSFLIEGWNSMNIDLWYTKGGHAAIQIRAKQYCCNSWSDKWEGDCPVN